MTLQSKPWSGSCEFNMTILQGERTFSTPHGKPITCLGVGACLRMLLSHIVIKFYCVPGASLPQIEMSFKIIMLGDLKG